MISRGYRLSISRIETDLGTFRKKRPFKRFSCRECKGFPGCEKLCPKAEGYAAQDEVKQREETIGIPVITEPPRLGMSAPVRLTKKEREIVKLQAVHGLSRAEIAKLLGLSRGALRQYLFRLREKIPMDPSKKEE
jgi:DNA-binding CsgD family transcriptional regulator